MRWLWPTLLALGVLVRLAIWWWTVGSNDVVGWASHAGNVQARGLAETYQNVALYNHPPLAGLYSALALLLADDDLAAFARWIKLPALAGEALAMLALGRIGGLRIAAIYAVLPAPILVAAYHGNTDNLYAALALLAVLAWERRRHALAGALLGLALDVKLIPLVLVPLFAIGAPSRRALFAFSLALGAALLPYLWPALEAGAAMYRNMVAYNSSADEWGWLAILNDAERSATLRGAATPLREAFLGLGRWLIMGGAVALAIGARRGLRLSMREQVALVSGLFLFLAPGFGIQYVAFAAPLLLAVSVRAGVFWGVAAGAFALALYGAYLVPGAAWYSAFYAPYPAWAVDIGVVAWAGLGVWMALRLQRARKAPMAPPLPQPAALAAR